MAEVMPLDAGRAAAHGAHVLDGKARLLRAIASGG